MVANTVGIRVHDLGKVGGVVGLPEHAIPLALAFFNIGVEAGQLTGSQNFPVWCRISTPLGRRSKFGGAATPSALGPDTLCRSASISYAMSRLSRYGGNTLSWQLHEAKNKLSEVIRRALSEGPQRVTRRDDAVIIIAESEYLKLTGKRSSLVQWLIENPMPAEIELPSRSDPPRPPPFQDDAM